MSYYYGPSLVKDGLVLCFDAANPKSYVSGSNTWYDLSGNNLSGSLNNGPSFNTGSKGNIVFDGSDDFVNIPYQLLSANSSFSIEMHINFTNFADGNYRVFMDSGNFGYLTGYCLAKSPQNRLYVAVNSGYIDVSGISSNNWYHIVATAQYGSPYVLKMYVNGTEYSAVTSAPTNTLSVPKSNICIARSSDSNTPGGNGTASCKVSTCKLYNRALSSQEILQNYNATKGRYNL